MVFADPSQHASLRNWTVKNIIYAEADNYGCSLGQELVSGVCAPCRSGRYRAETTKSDLLCQRCPLNSHSPLTTGAQTFASHGFVLRVSTSLLMLALFPARREHDIRRMAIVHLAQRGNLEIVRCPEGACLVRRGPSRQPLPPGGACRRRLGPTSRKPGRPSSCPALPAQRTPPARGQCGARSAWLDALQTVPGPQTACPALLRVSPTWS